MVVVTRCNMCGNDTPKGENWQAALYHYIPNKDTTKTQTVRFDICKTCKEKLLKTLKVPPDTDC